MATLFSYIRAVFLMVFIPFWTVFYSCVVIVQLSLGARKAFVVRGISQIWAKWVLIASGVKVKIIGAENLPKDQGFLYLFNHTSHYDIPVIFYASPKFCNFGAKSELFSIPFFGRAIRMTGALEIERSNREKVMRIYRESEKRVAAGEAFALAPEGTRKPGKGTLGDFKSGPFFFAVNSKMPIIPIILVGCELVVKKHSIFINTGKFSRQVIFEILPPIFPDFTKGEEQVNALKEKVHTIMQNRLKEWWSQDPFAGELLEENQ